MVPKFPRTPTFLLLFFIFCFSLLSGQQNITFKSLRATPETHDILKHHFTEYAVATLGADEVAGLLRSQDYFHELNLKVNGETYSFNLQARDLRAPHFKLRVHTDEGVIEMPWTPNTTYYGFTHKGKYDVRITSDVDFFYAMIVQEEDEIYIEPARHLIPGAPSNEFVIYRASHNLKKLTEAGCGVHHSHAQPFISEDQPQVDPDQESSGRACKVVQIALANDFLMFTQYNNIAGVTNHNMAVINNVETNYDDEFNDDLQFSIVEIFIATSAANDPWTSSTNSSLLLDNFTAWGPTGFSNTHDIASLWTNRNLDGDIVGLAWLSSVCSSFRYNLLEDFTSNANFLRVLQAHEMGHNFAANHDAAGSGTIMAPSINNTNIWSAASITSINNKINQVNCLGPCGSQSPPVANFTGIPTSGCAPLIVSFTDLSSNNPTTRNWTFPGGSPASSNLANPIVTYSNPGTFNVSLQVSNAQGSNSVTFFNYINVGVAPTAHFDFDVDGFGVDFQNNSSNATSYFWTFGDGNTSTQTNPYHIYAQDGFYSVTLTATNSCGSHIFTRFVEVITLPFADFTSNITQGCDPMEVDFINLSSSNADFFSWSFPGGSPPTSNAYQPSIIYETPGTYNVSLTVYNDAGQHTHTEIGYITVIPQPNAEFSFVTNNLQVTFNSLGSVGDSFFWNFGDGNVSTAQNPVHTYSQPGVYVVTLTVSNSCGNNVLQLGVSVLGAPVAGFGSNTQYGCAPLVVQFTNQSQGNPTSYSWVFQGGTPGTSNIANPVVTYNNPGVYDVQLTVTNAVGTDVLLLDDYIEVEFPTTSAFDFFVDGFQVSFFNQSTHSTGSTWFFGDGLVGDDVNPVHTYDDDGVYTVTMVSYGICGNDTSTVQIVIQTPPQAEFSYQQLSGCTPALIQFINESSDNATSFAWSFPGGNPSTSTDENPLVTYLTAGIFDASLIAYSPGGSDTLVWPGIVSIEAPPSAVFLLSAANSTITLNNQSTDADSYFWQFGDGETSTESDPVHTYPGFGTYTLTLIATNECGSDTMSVVIILSTVPHSLFGYSTHTGCAPFEVQFTDQSQNNPTAWEWTFEGGSPSTSVLQHPLVVYEIPGAHSVTLRTSNSHGSDVLMLHSLIRVGGVPDAHFDYSQDDQMVLLEYNGIDYDSLRWSFGDSRTDNSLNPVVHYPNPGQYQISLIVYNPCGSDTSSVWVDISPTSTNNPNTNESGWQIRPNPFNDILTIWGEPDENGQVDISLLDVHGRLISTEKWSYSTGQAIKEIDAAHLPTGVVLVVIQDRNSSVVLKAVHQPTGH